MLMATRNPIPIPNPTVFWMYPPKTLAKNMGISTYQPPSTGWLSKIEATGPLKTRIYFVRTDRPSGPIP